MRYTHHGNARRQQRGISPLEAELLAIYGSQKEQPGGTTLTYLSAKGYKRLEKDLKRVNQRLSKLRDEYLIESGDSTVITIGYRTRNLKLK